MFFSCGHLNIIISLTGLQKQESKLTCTCILLFTSVDISSCVGLGGNLPNTQIPENKQQIVDHSQLGTAAHRNVNRLTRRSPSLITAH